MPTGSKADRRRWGKANPAPRATIADSRRPHRSHPEDRRHRSHRPRRRLRRHHQRRPGARRRLDVSRADRRAPPPRLHRRRDQEDPRPQPPARDARGRDGVGGTAEDAGRVADAVHQVVAKFTVTTLQISVNSRKYVDCRTGRQSLHRRVRRERRAHQWLSELGVLGGDGLFLVAARYRRGPYVGRDDASRGRMPFEMVAAEFVLELEIQLLDGPSMMRQPNRDAQRGRRGQAEK